MNKEKIDRLHVLVIILIILTAILIWKQYCLIAKIQNLKDQQVSPVTQEDTIKSEQATILPEGFVEYQNEKYGFAISYPKSWGSYPKESSGSTRVNNEEIFYTDYRFGEHGSEGPNVDTLYFRVYENQNGNLVNFLIDNEGCENVNSSLLGNFTSSPAKIIAINNITTRHIPCFSPIGYGYNLYYISHENLESWTNLFQMMVVSDKGVAGQMLHSFRFL